jgi:type I restriction enzyme S subunit
MDGWIDQTEETITDEALASSSAKLLPAQTVLLALYGATVGQLGLLRREMACNQACCAMIVDPGKADCRFLFYQLLLSRPQLKRLATGAAQQNLSGQLVRSFRLPFPPLPEQQAIACVLGALDDKIELNRRRNRTLEAMARAIFQSWFVDFDPVRAKASGRQPTGLSPDLAALFPDSFEDSLFGPIPKGWAIQTLAQLTDKIGSGATPRGGEKVYVNEGIALVRSQNVYDHEFHWEGLAHITPEVAAALDGVALEEGDILFNITGASILRTCIVDPCVLPARVNQHVARIRARRGVPSRFLQLHLVRDQTKQYLLGFNAGATREAVTKGHLQSFRLIVPPDELLEAFANAVGPLYGQVQSGLEQSRTLAALRDALLPKLISGELRVPDAERIVGRTV